jgi:hypothetical protein
MFNGITQRKRGIKGQCSEMRTTNALLGEIKAEKNNRAGDGKRNSLLFRKDWRAN